MSAPLDTAGFLTRDAKEFAEFGKAWYGDRFESYEQKPRVCRLEGLCPYMLIRAISDHFRAQRLLPSPCRRQSRCAADLRLVHRLSAVLLECFNRHALLR